MQTDLQHSSSARRTISLLAIVTATAGIALATFDAGRRPLPAEASAGQSPVTSSLAVPAEANNDPSLVRSDTTTPRFERSNDPAIVVDTVNAHGG
jgi:hypothetical protein